MAETELPPRPAAPAVPKPIGIVASLYNQELVNGLVDAARRELEAVVPGQAVPLYRVPGAFEIPATVENLCRRGGFGAIIALGVIIRGRTAHADLIGTAVTNALQEIAVRHATPIIHEVLLVEDEEQARERCLGTRINRGMEAARTALSMSALFQQIEMAYPESQSNA